MVPIRIQLSLYPYLVSICFIELDVLRIPQSQIYHVIHRDFFGLFLEFICFWSFGSKQLHQQLMKSQTQKEKIMKEL
jgi:hypothetical protein